MACARRKPPAPAAGRSAGPRGPGADQTGGRKPEMASPELISIGWTTWVWLKIQEQELRTCILSLAHLGSICQGAILVQLCESKPGRLNILKEPLGLKNKLTLGGLGRQEKKYPQS